MKILNEIIGLIKNHVELVITNSISVTAFVVAWLNSFTGILSAVALLSTIVYNGIKIYQALTKKRGDIKNVK